MSERRRSTLRGRAMLLVRGERAAVVSWVHRGLLPAYVVPLDGWTAVLPAGPSRALSPYDDAIRLLAGRPVASRLRSALGFFAVEGQAVISAHPCGWRAIQRWFVWSPGEGVLSPRQLAAGRPDDLAAAAGARDPAVSAGVRDVLVDGGGDAHTVLGDMLTVLSLPGSTLLDGGRDPAVVVGSILVEPGEQHVARFERIVKDDVRHRAELEED